MSSDILITTREDSRKALALDPEDKELIRSFLEATRHYSPERAGQLLDGISGPTIRRYRDGKLPSRLTSDTRLAMRRFMTAPEEETPEQAVAQTELESELERILEIVRLVGGKEEFSAEQRRGLKRDILNTYIDAFRDHGMDPRELYVMLGKVDRGEL